MKTLAILPKEIQPLEVLNRDYSDERHMHYPLHYCDILLKYQCEIMEGYHFPY